MIRFKVDSINPTLLEDFKLCGHLKDGGVLEIDEKTECYSRLRERLAALVPTTPVTLKSVIHGAVGLAKAAIGSDAAGLEVLESRKAICGPCEIRDGDFCARYRGGCGCFLPAKQKLASECCPKRKWLPVAPQTEVKKCPKC